MYGCHLDARMYPTPSDLWDAIRQPPIRPPIEQSAYSKIIDLGEVVVVVAEIIGLIADVSNFQHAVPRHPLGHS